ncbi:MAG: hypothetical protein DRZ76_01880 [Candidatus Nealsonbacteria bacterium]|nr:MAG: hypothetical protein DRZ76_01880 [Candidatus Nealsonbacteria bacterium]
MSRELKTITCFQELQQLKKVVKLAKQGVNFKAEVDEEETIYFVEKYAIQVVSDRFLLEEKLLTRAEAIELIEDLIDYQNHQNRS